MPTQERIQKQTRKQQREEAEQQEAQKHVDSEKLKADLDSILDEIDEVLNSESVTMARDFIQKGGQAVRVIIDATRSIFVRPELPRTLSFVG